jgi:hypothetical protein
MKASQIAREFRGKYRRLNAANSMLVFNQPANKKEYLSARQDMVEFVLNHGSDIGDMMTRYAADLGQDENGLTVPMRFVLKSLPASPSTMPLDDLCAKTHLTRRSASVTLARLVRADLVQQIGVSDRSYRVTPTGMAIRPRDV